MSSLIKFLVTESHRRKIHVNTETSGGAKKTPLVLNLKPSKELDTFLVSTTTGDLKLVHNSEQGVFSNFFELSLHDEDSYHFSLVDSLFVASCENEWGNVMMVEDVLTLKDVDNISTFFKAYELQAFQVITGPEGYYRLVESGLVVHPSGNGGVEDRPSLDTLKEWQSEHFVIGFINERPIMLNPKLDPYITFSTYPTYLGSLTRVGEFVAVYLHNPDRGVVVLRFEENEVGDE